MLHRYTLTLAGVTFLLLLAGGLVHGTGSGLACPDWPTCYGSFMPEMKGAVAIEHSHRLLASGVGLLTIGLGVLLWRSGRRALGVGAVALVVGQGVLGGLTVLYRLPDLVSTAHLSAGLAFFALLIYVAWWSAPARPSHPVAPAARRLLGGAALGVYLQGVLGAFVRHTESGLACVPDLALCRGALWPDLGPARLHMAHRLGAVLVAALVIAAAAAAVRAGLPGRLRLVARALPLLVLAQIGLGVAVVYTGLSLWSVQAHLGVAAALWAGTLTLWLCTRAAAPAAAPDRPAAVPAEARA